MHGARSFLQDLALVLCVAAVTTVLFRRLRQPVVLGYLLAGLIVGPHTPIPLFAGSESIRTLSELGVILVMFGIGLEFSLRKLVQVFPRVGLVGLVQIVAMLWLGYVTGQALGWTRQDSFFTGAMLSISSTMIIAKVFAERRVSARLSELVLGVLIIEDVAAILMLAILTAAASGQGDTSGVLASTALRLGLFLVALTFGGYLLVPRAIRAVARLRSPETLLVASVGLCFACALLAEKAGYSVALGAFLAGSFVSESGRVKQVEDLVMPLRDLFAAVFFVSVGMLVDPVVVAEHGGAAVLLTVVVVAGKVLSVSLGAFLSGYDLSTALQAGMSMPQIGEFSFILAGAGVALGAIDPALYGIAVSVSAITSFLTPWLVRMSAPLALSIEHHLPRPLRTFATLYGSWLEVLRASWKRSTYHSRLLRHAVWLVMDVLCFAGVVIGTSVSLERLVGLLGRRGLSETLATTMVLVTAAVALLPFGIGIVRLSGALGAELAAAVLPGQESGRPDFALAPRRAFVVALQLSVVMVVGGPLLALTLPFVPFVYEVVVVLVALSVLAVVFWRRASDLEAHVRAGAQVVVEALQRQLERSPAEPSLEEVHPLLPGLGQVTPVVLEAGSPAIGRTLAALDLRARTGGTVIAIHRHGKGIIAPTGREVLQVGDVLAVAGSREAIEAAQELLENGRLPGRPVGVRDGGA